jgi:chromosome partitioning protein
MPQTIAVLSQKGGTGKTTVVRTLSDAFRRSGVSTLAIDLDPQGNLSDYFDLPPDVQPTIAEVLLGTAAVQQATHDDMVPANLSLAEAELLLGGKMGRELTLRRALAKEPPPYELILIDCPPSLGLLTVNALVAADHALITAEAQYFALQGVEQAIEVVELARDSLNPGLALLGVLLNVADMRTVHSREALASLRERFDRKVFDTVIRASIAYAESAERAVSILDHRPDLGADYLSLAEEVLSRLAPSARDDAEDERAEEAAALPAEDETPEVAAAAEPVAPDEHTAPAPARDAYRSAGDAPTEAYPRTSDAPTPSPEAPTPPRVPAPDPPPTGGPAQPAEADDAGLAPDAPARKRIVDGAQAPGGERGYDGAEEPSRELGAGASQ